MATYKNPVTGQTVSVDESQAAPYTSIGWTPTANVSNPTFTSITPQSLAPTPNINLPPQPTINNGAGVISGGNAEINALAGTTIQPTATAQPSSIDDMLKSLGVGTPPTDLSGTYDIQYQSSDAYRQEQALAAKAQAITVAKREFDTYNAQLKGIEDKAKQQSLILEGQNKAAGVNARVATLLNREQQEINRQAAIEALPIQGLALAAQAKLIAAQGDEANAQNVYQMALNKFDMGFKLKMDYEDKMYQYRKDQRNALLAERDFLTKEEQIKLDTLQKADDRKYQEQKDNSALAQSWVKKAVDNGQANIAEKISALDEKSPTFQADLAKLQSQITIKQKLDTSITEVGGRKFLIDNQTGKTIQDLGSSVKSDTELVYNMAGKYVDAGILPTDTLAAAQAKLKNSRIYQDQVRGPVRVGGGGGGGGGGGDGGDEVSDFDYARQIIEANPNATPEELKVGLLEQVSSKKLKLSITDINSLIAEKKQKTEAKAEANKPETFSQDWFKSKIANARTNDFSDTEIIDYIIKNFDINELFKTAKEAGYAKWYTGKESDIKRYIESLL